MPLLLHLSSNLRLPALLLAALLVACANDPTLKLARDRQLEVHTVQGQPFLHRVVRNAGTGPWLHVYIEGDGRPWHRRNQVAMDPTPRSALMLQLMSEDPAPSIYLGRPCYFNVADPNCSSIWWTHRRYAREVVLSLSTAIDQYSDAFDGIVLFGHSGGGTLAMLLAQQREDVRMVVTLAGNLDVKAWAELHDYSPLQGSLNPYREPPLDRAISQLHLAGAEDTTIPADMLSRALSHQPEAVLRVVPGADHACCWEALWPEVLATVDAETTPRQAGGSY